MLEYQESILCSRAWQNYPLILMKKGKWMANSFGAKHTFPTVSLFESTACFCSVSTTICLVVPMNVQATLGVSLQTGTAEYSSVVAKSIFILWSRQVSLAWFPFNYFMQIILSIWMFFSWSIFSSDWLLYLLWDSCILYYAFCRFCRIITQPLGNACTYLTIRKADICSHDAARIS